ncbi:MAG: mechanosensitive ion channel domain-containing protein [Pseudomonadota bacterium]
MEPETETTRVLKECVSVDGEEFCRPIGAAAAGQGAETEAGTGPAPVETSAAEGGLVATARGYLDPIIADPWGWLQANILTPEFLIAAGIQVGAIFGALFVGVIFSPTVKRLLRMGLARLPDGIRKFVEDPLPRLVLPALWAGALWVATTIVEGMGQPAATVRIAASLGTAWLMIKTATLFVPEGLRKPVTWLALAIAVLAAFGVLDDVIAWSYTVGPVFGGRTINPPFLLQAVVTAAVFLFGASWLSKKLKTRVETLPQVEPSLRILLSNALQIGLFFAAAVLTLAGLSIPLSGLAVLGGAIGVGIGFGMQQIVANFISGVILLTDRSIKPDDVIEVDETYGVVKSLGLRYASVVTRDGKEHLIPNEQLITDKVVNWSYSNKEVRIKRRLRVEYETDLKMACSLVVEGAKMTPRVIEQPAPVCLVMEFGEEAVELEARFWVNDPENGINNVGSAVMLNVWDRFKEHGIDIPLRHEDVLITPGSTLKVEMVRQKRSPNGLAEPDQPQEDREGDDQAPKQVTGENVTG